MVFAVGITMNTLEVRGCEPSCQPSGLDYVGAHYLLLLRFR